jgi:hypothetical protein
VDYRLRAFDGERIVADYIDRSDMLWWDWVFLSFLDSVNNRANHVWLDHTYPIFDEFAVVHWPGELG